MPSGAKKRKAAKKKKGGDHSNNTSSAHSHGDENVDFKEGGEERIEVDDNVVRVEREFEIEDKSDKKDGDSSRSSNSGSSSSSDDESPAIKNTQALDELATVLDSLKEGEPNKEACDSIVENIPSSGSDNISLSVEKVEVAPLVEPAVEENGEKKSSSVEDKVGPSVVLVDAVSEKEEEVIFQSVEKNEAIKKPEECVTIQENDDKLTVSFNAPTTTMDDDAEREKVSGVTEPLLAPHPVQRTSWKSCCGLFEVFSGSRS